MRINFYNPYHNFLGKVNPSTFIRSKTDPDVELFPKYYDITPVTEKYLCVVVKAVAGDLFILTHSCPK
jgi:hypothetical protein